VPRHRYAPLTNHRARHDVEPEQIAKHQRKVT
jgi:hypothetical protein